MTEKRKQKFYAKDILFSVDFVINVVLIIIISLFYAKLYAEVGTSGFVYEAIMASNGIVMIGYATSFFTVVIELIYGVMRIKGKEPDETGTLIHWAMIWVILKCMLLLLVVMTSLLGVDLKMLL